MPKLDKGVKVTNDNKQTVQFTGDGASYFGIWIVNLLLTIVTVGLYSPWAKVRRLRYFYGNTLVDGSPFEFHGSPIAILKGRILGLLLFLAYSQSAKLSILLWVAVVILLLVAAPWIAWKSLRFRLINSSYRGVRFGFGGSLAQSYATFAPAILVILLPAFFGFFVSIYARNGPPPVGLIPLFVLVFLAEMALLPWLYLRIKRYQHAHAQFGVAGFAFSGSIRGVYGLALKVVGIGLVAVVAGVVIGVLAGLFLGLVASGIGALPLLPSGTSASASAAADKIIVIFGGSLAGYLVLLSAFPLASALAQNFVWGQTSLASESFASEVDPFVLWRIQFVNVLLLIVTLGLYWPYAIVRLTRYRLSCVGWSGDPAVIAGRPRDTAVGAAGEEAMEIFGFDLAL